MAERIGWLNRHARLTERLRAWGEALTELLPIAHVAKLTELHWHTINEIDKAHPGNALRGSNSLIRESGQVGSLSSALASQANGSNPLSFAVPSRL